MNIETPAADNIIQLGPIKKQSVRPPDPLLKPVVTPPPGAVEGDLMLAPFPDGVLFKCSPKPNSQRGEMLIHDGAGTIVGACINQAMANLFCEALFIYFQAAKQNAAAQQAAKTVEETLAAPVSGNAVIDEAHHEDSK